MTAWLFQGNPDRFDIDAYLASEGAATWEVRQEQFAPEMKSGDRVFFWRAAGSAKRRNAGVIAAGVISSPPRVQVDDERSMPLWTEASEGLRETLRVSVNLDPPTARCLVRERVEAIPELANMRVLRMANETNYKLTVEEHAVLEKLWADADRDLPVAWLLIALDPEERQHAGNSGYADDVEHVYRFDSYVPNWKRVRRGDVVFLRSSRLLGVARIQELIEESGMKDLRRCPTCAKTSIKARQDKRPFYRCSDCRAEFDEPIITQEPVQQFEARFGTSFIGMRDAIPLAQLIAACPTYNGQHAMQRIELRDLLPTLREHSVQIDVLLNDTYRLSDFTMSRVVTAAVESHAFDAADDADARGRTLRSIAVRRGQPDFRRALINAYEGRCSITGCNADEALEAAHIRPYRGSHTNHVQNGILLRADLHTLFDRGLIAVDPDTWTVVVHQRLMSTDYRTLHGQPVRLPPIQELRPSVEALIAHRRENLI